MSTLSGMLNDMLSGMSGAFFGGFLVACVFTDASLAASIEGFLCVTVFWLFARFLDKL